MAAAEEDNDGAYRFSSAALRKQARGRRGRSRLRRKKIITEEEASSREPTRALSSISLPASLEGITPMVTTAAIAPPPPPHELDLTSDVRVRETKKPWETDIWKEQKKTDRDNLLSQSTHSTKVESRRKSLRRSRSLSAMRYSGFEEAASHASFRRSMHRSLSRDNRKTLDEHFGAKVENETSASSLSSSSNNTEDDLKYIEAKFGRSKVDDDGLDPNDEESDDESSERYHHQSRSSSDEDNRYRLFEKFRDEDETYAKYRQFLRKNDSSDEEDDDETAEFYDDETKDPREKLLHETAKPRQRKSLVLLSGKKLSAAPSLDFAYRYSAAAEELLQGEPSTNDVSPEELCEDPSGKEENEEPPPTEISGDTDYIEDPLEAMAAAEELFRTFAPSEKETANEEPSEIEITNETSSDLPTNEPLKDTDPVEVDYRHSEIDTASLSSSSMYTKDEIEEEPRDSKSVGDEMHEKEPTFVGDIHHISLANNETMTYDEALSSSLPTLVTCSPSETPMSSPSESERPTLSITEISPLPMKMPLTEPTEHSVQTKASEITPSKEASVQTKASEMTPSEELSVQTKTSQITPSEEHSIQTKASEITASEEHSVQTKASEITASEEHSVQTKASEITASEEHSLQTKESEVISHSKERSGHEESSNGASIPLEKATTRNCTIVQQPTIYELAGAHAATVLAKRKEEEVTQKIDEWAKNAKAIAIQRLRSQMEAEAAKSLAKEAKRLAQNIRKRELAASQETTPRVRDRIIEASSLQNDEPHEDSFVEDDEKPRYEEEREPEFENDEDSFVEDDLSDSSEQPHYEEEGLEQERDFMAMLYHIHSI